MVLIIENFKLWDRDHKIQHDNLIVLSIKTKVSVTTNLIL